MILYTVLPLEDVYDGLEEEIPPTTHMVRNGVLMEVEMCGDFEAKVVRVISSNPNDYLAADNQPGSILRMP
jgi:hypothetical protein